MRWLRRSTGRPSVVAQALLDDDQRSLYDRLRKAVEPDCLVFARVPAGRLFPPLQYGRASASDCLDFVICNPTTTMPIAVIEIDRPDRPAGFDAVLGEAGVAVIGLPAGTRIPIDELRAAVLGHARAACATPVV